MQKEAFGHAKMKIFNRFYYPIKGLPLSQEKVIRVFVGGVASVRGARCL